MIVFEKIRWRNLLSTGNEFTEIILNKTKTTLIVGVNGAGKSTLLDALSFVLYGRAFRDITKPQLVNTITNSQLEVELEFSADGCKYVVVRGMKPDIFEIYKNDELIGQEASARDYQSLLEVDILKMNYKAFKQVVVLGSADYVPFMKLKADHRRQVIEDIVNIQIFTVMAAMLKKKSDLVRDNIRIVGANLEGLKRNLQIHQKYQVSFEEDSQAIIDALNNEKADKLGLIKTLQDDIKEHQLANVDRSRTIANQTEIVNALEEVERIENALTTRLQGLKREVRFLEANEVCPTCTQDIKEDFKHEAVSKRSGEIVKLVEGSEKIDQKISALRKRMSEMTNISNEIRASQQAIANLENEIRFFERQIEELETKIQEAAERSETHVNRELIADLTAAIRNEARVIETLYSASEVHEYATVLLKDTGIKARLLKKYIPLINQLINDYLQQMNSYIHFELDENFAETIRSPYRDKFTYSSFSEGEKLRINLAILFTWREIAKMRNSMSTNLLIMDEIFDSSLDDAGVEDFLKILEDMMSDTNIFVISHKSQMFDKFRGAIRFEKQGNFSKIAKDGV